MSDQGWVAPGSPPAPPTPDPSPAAPQPTAYPAQPQPTAYPPQLQPTAYPPQPQPTAYPSQSQSRTVGQVGYEFRPGVIPLRPLMLGDIFGAALKTVRGNIGATIGLATLVSLAVLIPTTSLGAWVSGQADIPLTADGSSSSDAFPVQMLGMYLPALGTAVGAVLLAGIVAFVVGQAVLGLRVSMGQTWAGTAPRLPALLGTVGLMVLAAVSALTLLAALPGTLLVTGLLRGSDALSVTGGIGLALALLVFIALAVVVGTRWSLATPAVVLEAAGPVAALRRSWRLVGTPARSSFWRILGIRLLTTVITSTVAQVLTLPIVLLFIGVIVALFSDGGGNLGDLFFVETAVIGATSLLTSALTTPFTAGVDALLYVDSRIRTEGLDIALITAAQGSGPPPWPRAL